MQVILLERVEKLGQIGDVVKVKDGFARNYLLPKKKALRATKQNRDYFETQRVQLEARNLERRGEAQGVAGKLEGSFPQFDDRLRSTVNFTGGQIPGSSVMQQRVMDETAELAKNVNFERAIARKPVYLSVAGAVASVILVGGLAAWGAEAGVLGIALDRLPA